MIINVRGTGGSGKSTLVRKVMATYEDGAPEFVIGRKRPIGYICTFPGRRSLYVVGHYETPCGGGDTIKTAAEVFQRVDAARNSGHDVIFEGIISQDDIKRLVALHEETGGDVLVVGLRVPLEECLAGIEARRAAKGNSKPLNPLNTTNRAKSVARSMEKLAAAGVTTVWASRDDALSICLRAFEGGQS